MKVRGYVSSRDFMGHNIPQQVQNMAIRDYCLKNNLEYHLSEVEYSMKGSFFSINGLIQDIQAMKGIVFYSIFQLPENETMRLKILTKSKKKNIILFFAIESMVCKTQSDIKEIDELIRLKLTLKNPNLVWPYKIDE
tara:strand:+ start:911 stop:1321 length:411 start_codon:yes stop_codon:yes gene_type:complete